VVGEYLRASFREYSCDIVFGWVRQSRIDEGEEERERVVSAEKVFTLGQNTNTRLGKLEIERLPKIERPIHDIQ